ncbi:MAG: NifU N-terminal domain-containing protein [Planctomycetota bacterium]
MPKVLRYETTPNPDALKLVLDAPVSHGPRSFLSADDARGDPIAGPLFETGSIRAVLINTDWVTINRVPGSAWPALKSVAERAIAAATPPAGS